jgi:hypothetical protein
MAIETLLKAVSYFECAISAVIPNVPDHIKAKLPADLMEGMFIALQHQALGQAVELQLGFAVENVTASLAVKRRLACEQVKCWEQVCSFSFLTFFFSHLNHHFPPHFENSI